MTKIVRRNGGNEYFETMAPLFTHGVGFDRIMNLMDAALQETQNEKTNYPPYDIVQTSEDEYTIQMAVAGFSIDDLEIKIERNILMITGVKSKAEAKGKFLYQGISNRKFVQRFNLSDHIIVRDASFTNGMLTVELVREIPEALKPRKIEIQAASNVIPEIMDVDDVVDDILEAATAS